MVSDRSCNNKLVTTELTVQCRKSQVTYGVAGMNKQLSYRRETARQLPTSRGGGLNPPVYSAFSGYTYGYGRIRKPQRTYVKLPSVKRKAHIKMNRHSRSFKVILIGAGRSP